MTMTFVVFFLLAAFISLFVALPVLQTRGRLAGWWGSKEGNHRAGELQERKENIYAAIKEIEFDYQMGKLSKEDFLELREQYKTEAVNLLKEIDQIEQKGTISPAAANKKSPAPGAGVQFCWMCGNPVTESDRFCPNCGNKLAESA